VRKGDRLLVVGAGAAGAATAAAYRESGGPADVLLLGSEQHPPYQRPPLTKEFLRGESDRDDLWLHDRAWYAEREIELKLGAAVVAVDLDLAEVEDERGERHGFDVCVLATGSRPVIPDSVERGLQGVHAIRELERSERLRESAGRGSKALVVGSGFIGCEAAISLSRLGADVRMITLERLPQIARLGPDAALRIRDWLAEEGVWFEGETSLESITGDGGDPLVRAGGLEVRPDVVLIALGIERNVELAHAAGLHLEDGAIRTDSSMRTSDPRVFAVGDVAAAMNVPAGRHLLVEHWGEALNHGAIAGAAIAGATGDEASWTTAPGFWSSLGGRVLKQVAWGDGFDSSEFTERGNGAFEVSYQRDDELVGVLAHDWDRAYERGQRILEGRG